MLEQHNNSAVNAEDACVATGVWMVIKRGPSPSTDRWKFPNSMDSHFFTGVHTSFTPNHSFRRKACAIESYTTQIIRCGWNAMKQNGRWCNTSQLRVVALQARIFYTWVIKSKALTPFLRIIHEESSIVMTSKVGVRRMTILSCVLKYL